ncbi:MAG: hydrogenase nickel incorporation protein HypB [Bacteroidetes bacterium]|nr:hydrogenase nickel incorporation protein HypB [Bacteroidota bacterium]
MSIVTIERKVLEKNDEIAKRNREEFQKRKIFVLNLVSSPGSGKTSILEKTLEYFQGTIPIAIIEGDVQTNLDAQRIAKYNVPVVQVVTNGLCHLEAKFISEAFDSLTTDTIKLLIIENVGNLVCPSGYDLGEHHKVVVLSVTEGDDKPLKYPAMFRNASVLLINKVDLLPYLSTDIEEIKKNALSINPKLILFEISCTANAGIEQWGEWLKTKIEFK